MMQMVVLIHLDQNNKMFHYFLLCFIKNDTSSNVYVIHHTKMYLSSIRDIPTDLIHQITHHLPYHKCLLLLVIFKDLKVSESTFRQLFTQSELFHKSPHIHKTLAMHSLTPVDFYYMMKAQSFNAYQTYEMLDAICKNKITKDNKSHYVLNHSSDFATPPQINATIKMSHIILTSIDCISAYDDQIINCQYYSLHTYVNNNTIDYIINVITKRFETTKNIREYTKEFRFTIYTNYWYRSNINLYVIFCLYLMNRGVLRAKHTEVISTLASNISTIDNHSIHKDTTLTFAFEFFHLFQVNKWMSQFFIIFLQYIKQHNIYIESSYQKETCEYIYQKIMEECNIPEYIKDDVTEAFQYLLTQT